MVLPLIKLGTLLIRTASKPLATAVKARATKHPRFRDYIVYCAQSYHHWSTQFQRRMYGHDTDAAIKPLNPERAVQAAADLVGEGIIFAVGCSVVVFEYARSSRSDSRREEARRRELETIELTKTRAESRPKEDNFDNRNATQDLRNRIAALETVREWKESMLVSGGGEEGQQPTKGHQPSTNKRAEEPPPSKTEIG